jgi:hypothetical protein
VELILNCAPVLSEVEGSKGGVFPTLQNIRQENRVLKRKNISGVRAELKDFSLNTRFLANSVRVSTRRHTISNHRFRSLSAIVGFAPVVA